MMSFRKIAFQGLLTALFLAVAVPACNTLPPVPPPEAILAGTWTLTPDRNDLGFKSKQLVFNSKGVLTQITTINTSFLGDPTTVVENDLNLPSVVAGKAVEVRMTPKTFPGDGKFIFNGNFNDDSTVATGDLSTQVQIFFTSTTVVTQQGTGTLSKNPS